MRSTMTKNNDLTCQVCDKNKAVGVCCIPSVPVTVAYCSECLQANAHPWFILISNTACCGGLEHMADFWRKMVTDTCKHLNKTLDEFNADVVKDIKNLEEYEPNA